MSISEATRQKALNTLNGMAEIARSDMMKPGSYVSDKLLVPQRAKAICGGHHACAIGSLWLGGGVKMVTDKWGDAELPGVSDGVIREQFLAPRHGLRTAYNALNDAASDYIDTHQGLNINYQFGASIEALFEGTEDDNDPQTSQIGIEAMLAIIDDAKSRVMTM